jgi:hypothetical protein
VPYVDLDKYSDPTSSSLKTQTNIPYVSQVANEAPRQVAVNHLGDHHETESATAVESAVHPKTESQENVPSASQGNQTISNEPIKDKKVQKLRKKQTATGEQRRGDFPKATPEVLLTLLCCISVAARASCQRTCIHSRKASFF